MQNTPNYNYNLPEYSDSADIAVLNANFSSIDANEYRIEGKLNALGNDIALPYDNTATYSVGDYAIYNNALYRCITAIATAEDFDSAKWTAITIGGELKNHDTRISTLEAGVDLEKSATNSFDDGIDSYFKKIVSTIVPVQAGSGTPSPTNVRAISGFTECTVTDEGKNLANLQPRSETSVANVKSTIYADNRIVASGTSTGNGDISINLVSPIKLKKGITYTFSLSGTYSGTQYIYLIKDISSPSIYTTFNMGKATFTLTEDANITIITIRAFSGTTISIDAQLQCETGNQATAYTPYITPTTATISFDSAGTVYGGYVDLVSGKLVVDKGYIVPTEVIEVMTPIGAERWRIALNGLGITDVEGAFSSHFNAVYANNPGCFYITSSRDSLVVLPTDQSLNTKALADAWLQANNPQFVYKLATPQEYQLTPAQLRSLVGANRLTSSTGEVTEVEYIKNKTIAWLLDLIRA